MAKLKEYNTINEKEEFFMGADLKVVFNIESIFSLLEGFKNAGSFIFRGCSEAKHKLYNSAQRTFIQSELYLQATQDNYEDFYDKWIENLILNCRNWNAGTVTNLLKASGINPDNTFAYLSYMQHYGAPTPLIDFTRDPYIALYFAIENICNYPSDNEIDNYFSVYYTTTTNTAIEGLNRVFESSIPESGMVTYETLSNNILLIPDNKYYKLLNNSNIINQKGLFFYNSNPYVPLEEVYKGIFDEVKINTPKEIYAKIPEKEKPFEEVCGCYNIHKSLAPYIRNKLKERGITHEFIYPDAYKLKDYIIHNSFAQTIYPTKPI